MESNVRFSTKFLASQNAHQVALLVGISGQATLQRPRLNLSLVVDRSGSMGGGPLDHAKEAATRIVRGLAPTDRASVVAYDHEVQTIWGPGAGGDPAADSAIAQLRPGGSTNLSAGWLEGRRHVAEAQGDGINRVLLLTDGQANQGIVAGDTLRGMTAGARGQGVHTTCIGFGAHFNEDLLRTMSDAGGGQFWYVETLEQLGPMLQGEIEGLLALAAQNLVVKVIARHPRLSGVSVAQGLPMERTPDGDWVVRLGDLLATRGVEVGLTLHIEERANLGATLVAEVEITADVLTPEGIQHKLIRLPVTADLDQQSHRDPRVETAFTRFEAVRARETAVAQADQGDIDGAARILRDAARALRGLERPEAADLDRAEDLEQEARRMEEGRYDHLMDRKYLVMRNQAEKYGRMDKERLSRRRGPSER